MVLPCQPLGKIRLPLSVQVTGVMVEICEIVDSNWGSSIYQLVAILTQPGIAHVPNEPLVTLLLH